MSSVHEDQTCRICGTQVKAPTARKHDDMSAIQCWICGDYEITPEAYLALHEVYTEQKRYLLSGRARMSVIETGIRHRFDLDEIGTMKKGLLRDKNFSECALSVMRYLASRRPGTDVRLTDQDYPVGYCKTFNELRFIVSQLGKAGLVITDAGSALSVDAQLSGKGWQWLEEQIKEGTGQQAFIAMSFAPELEPTERALRAGVLAAGYEAVLVKDREFEHGIVDKIFAEIRRSHFVIADFTQNKAGVYYEAGFALGLGLRVIGTCENSHLELKAANIGLHFDVRHLNMIAWTADQLPELTRRVETRIRALFGEGPKAIAH